MGTLAATFPTEHVPSWPIVLPFPRSPFSNKNFLEFTPIVNFYGEAAFFAPLTYLVLLCTFSFSLIRCLFNFPFIPTA